MREAVREIWNVFWRAALLLSALGLLLAIGGVVWMIYPWRHQNVPLHAGMTVEDLGRAPGTLRVDRFSLDPPPRP